jgi:4-hydroxy-tetrahydrodipicolinate synthase
MLSTPETPTDRSARNHYGGVIAAAVTPCNSAGAIDADAMANLSGLLVEHGCQGLFVVSSTGEMPLLDEDDRSALIAAAARGMQGRGCLYAGVTGFGLKQSVRYAQAAADAGADVAVIMAPLFLRYSQPELVDYVTRFADESPLPVALYHHVRMPTSFDVETVATLAQHSNIVAMKDTSGDLERMQRMVEATAGERFSLLQGSERLLVASLQAGAHGSVTALANVAPEWHASLWQALARGAMAEAGRFQDKIERLWQMFDEPPVRESLSRFVYTLKRPLVKRGWLDCTAGMMTDIRDPEMDALIDKHLAASGWDELAAARRTSAV